METMEIDSWEPAAYKVAVHDAFRAEGLAVVVRSLDCGDYAWELPDGRPVRVERKRPADLAASLTDGRWADQIARLADMTVPVLLIEGTIIYRPDGTLGYEGVHGPGPSLAAFDGGVLAAQIAGGLVVAHSGPGPLMVARRLLSIWRILRAEEHQTLWPRRRAGVLPGGAAILAALPGVGPKTAKKLLAKHGSALAALNAIAAGEGPEKWRVALAA